MFFAKIIKKQGEKILKQDNKIQGLKERNKELNTKNMILERFKDNTEKILENADLTKENYFVTFKKIKKELDNASGKCI